MTLPPSVTLIEEPAGYPVLVIEHAAATGRIALNGAHVTDWIPEGHDPVLYMSADAILETGKPIRGGIPVCWPWFGPHPTDSTKPAHGFVRQMAWEVDVARESDAGVDIVLKLQDSAESKAFWPHSFQVRMHVHMGATLQVSLQAQNTGTAAWTMTGALHTYLNVEDVRKISIHGLHGTQYVEGRLSPDKRPQSGMIIIDQEVDRMYISDATVIVHDPLWKRELVIEKAGSLATVVWNPWIEKSKRLADLPDEAYPEFLCIEAANAGEDVVTVQPGHEHLLTQRIEVRKL
ncbi:D-hexose-6-phosphate mutarotase [Prosthecobacter vanneervenii]|uniref:Putative glucose-6-phosphate 1-epimerase n=1 Tax=Prosthecobacter vanneervenii TaxID=48466 RepID=A0A7W8DIG5_9BACT|nr:D-hexose-6-phosphate mutarotase [Prosthecobacter vanneervenii]MBB5030920.1 glucose-6-phosphate 1-epimerase [Prosthecobacter vanneervenii]